LIYKTGVNKMPTYDFKCIFCDFKFEKKKKIIEANENEYCPQCGSLCEKVISGGLGFILKGSGWYKETISPDKKKE